MQNLFYDILDKYVVVYLDDILKFSNDIESHERYLRDVL